MKIVRFATSDGPRVGVLQEGRIHAFQAGVHINELLELGLDGLLAAGADAVAGGDVSEERDVRLLAPVEPRFMRDYTTFEQHVEGMMLATGQKGIPEDFYVFPPSYGANPHVIIGPADDVPLAPGTERFDLELEVAAVIGPSGGDFDQAEARRHIIGYTIFNDWSARDLLFREIRQVLGPAKGKDTASTLGPWLVTVDELETYRNAEGRLELTMSAYVNDELLGSDSMAHASWSPESCVQFASRGSLLKAGDVLGLGTCGTGCLAELWGRFGADFRPALQPGDVVRVEVTGLGSLTSRIVEGVPVKPLPEGLRVLQDLQPTFPR